MNLKLNIFKNKLTMQKGNKDAKNPKVLSDKLDPKITAEMYSKGEQIPT